MSHVEALFEWKPSCHIQLFARNQSAASSIAIRMRDLGCHIEVVDSLPDAIARSSVVVTATSSRKPFLLSSMIAERDRSSLLLVAVGAYRSDMAELSPALVSRVNGPIGVDTVAGASSEAGDLLGANIPIDRMLGLENFDSSTLRGSLHLFKSVGNALWDLAAARSAF